MHPLEVGFYGKLPSHGDFLHRRVSDAFIGVWDGWLQECLTASRSALGARWLDVYLTSPAWRFGCAGGVCGPAPVVGVMVPSVDRVGRYFPLTLVAQLPDDASVLLAATLGSSFFDEAETLLIETLEAEHVDFEEFDERVMSLSTALDSLTGAAEATLEPAAAAVLADNVRDSWQIPLGTRSHLGSALAQLLSQRMSTLYAPLVLWWTGGSSIVEPSCLITKGLPHPDAFAALLDGAWRGRQWRSVGARVEPARPEHDTLIEPTPPRFRSAAASDVGRVRSVNQDAFVECTDIGLWAVADGLGGHSEGEVASRMVCDALADFAPQPTFEETIDATCRRLQDVNEHLVRGATREVNPVRSGSTVVTLLTRGSRCAVLWAGDSRVYRWRGGGIEQLTKDHGDLESTAVTRAVGGDATLEIDCYRDRVHVGDRFLLCSDGLTRVVPVPQIRTWMEHEDIRAAVDGLVGVALEAGAPDNVTVLIVEALA
jgi:type VI secretion system protein ImpM